MFLSLWSAALIFFSANFVWHSITKSQEDSYSSIWCVWSSHNGIAEDSSLLRCYAMSIFKYLLMFRRIILPPSSVPNIWTTRSWKRRSCDPSKVSNYLPLDRTYPCRRRRYSTSGVLVSFFVVATKGFLPNWSRPAWFLSLLCGVCIKYGISRFCFLPPTRIFSIFSENIVRLDVWAITLTRVLCGQVYS